MRSEWESLTFGELIKLGELDIGDGYRAKNDELGGGGLIFLRAGHVADSHIDFNGTDRFQTTNEQKFGAKISRSGDVVVTTKGNSTGRLAFVTPSMPRFVYSPHLSYWRASAAGRLNQSFLRAWSRCSEFSVQLAALSRSTDMAPYLSLTDQRRLRITIPPKKTQCWIGSLNDDFDARLELLRETSLSLEAIAQTLFKSWFVDFDPVRAKAEGREPEGMDAATAALFPSEFEESELGLVPKGWRPTRVGDVVTMVKGRSYKSAELEDSDVALVTLKSFNRGGGFRRDGFKPYTGTYRDDQVVSEGECIVAFTDVTQQAELIGRTAIVTGSQKCGRLVASLDVGILRPKMASLTPAFLRALLSGERYVGHIKGYTTGTTVLHLAKTGLPSYLFVLPPDELIASWQRIGGACIERQALNVRKIDLLTDLRDTLLPRLISGKLRLPEAVA